MLGCGVDVSQRRLQLATTAPVPMKFSPLDLVDLFGATVSSAKPRWIWRVQRNGWPRRGMGCSPQPTVIV